MGQPEARESGEGPTDPGNALLAEEPDETSYDEEQWERTMTRVPPETGEDAIPGAEGDDAEKSSETGPLPDLAEVVKNVPSSSRDLIDSLFRGQFTNVKVIDRKKLF